MCLFMQADLNLPIKIFGGYLGMCPVVRTLFSPLIHSELHMTSHDIT